MLRTTITDAFNLSSPIVLGTTVFAGTPRLAAAVSNAGALGFLCGDLASPPQIASMLETTRRLTLCPFGLGFSGSLVTYAQICACLDAPPAAIAFTGERPPPPWINRLVARDVDVWLHVGSPHEARMARRQGAAAVIAMGSECDGHASPTAYAMSLVPIVEAVAPLPVIASGGLVDGRRLAAVLMLGADAGWCDTRFLLSAEAAWSSSRRGVALESAGDIIRAMSREADLILDGFVANVLGDAPDVQR